MTNHAQTISMLRAAAWAGGLTRDQLQRVELETQDRFIRLVRSSATNQARRRTGSESSKDGQSGRPVGGRPKHHIDRGHPNGGWLGEGSVLKGELRPYGVVALRDTRIALMPSQTFHY